MLDKRTVGEDTRTAGAIHAFGGGVWQTRNWLQLARFSTVGISGYALNLAVFAACHGVLGLHHLLAASTAFVAAVSFLSSKFWTFAWEQKG